MTKQTFELLKLTSTMSVTLAAKAPLPTPPKRLLFAEALSLARLHPNYVDHILLWIIAYDWIGTIYYIWYVAYDSSNQWSNHWKEYFRMKSLIRSIQIGHLKVFSVSLIYAMMTNRFMKISWQTLTITMKKSHATIAPDSVNKILTHVEIQMKAHQHARQGFPDGRYDS